MSDCFVGEIRLVGFSRIPSHWAACQGALLPISGYDMLFSLIGTRYGGNGMTDFALPDLRGRLPLCQGTNPATGTYYDVGQAIGTTSVTLAANQLPAHSHALRAVQTSGDGSDPTARHLGGGEATIYADTSNGQMNAGAVDDAGGNQPHDNMMPYLPMNFIIALAGIYPTRP